jgi:hypothetical protein
MAVELFTALTPIVPGREADLRRTLAGLPAGELSPLERVPGTHVARWVVLESLGMLDSARRRPLRPAQLLFSAALDGPLESWLGGLLAGLGPAATAIWSHCLRWPATGERDAVANWLREHRVGNTVPFVGHPDATVGQIGEALDRRARLLRLAIHAQGLPPVELRKAYELAFAPVEVP